MVSRPLSSVSQISFLFITISPDCDEPQIGNVDEGVVERGKDTSNAENELAY